MRVYSGSSSSDKMNFVKEETYRIARSLGATLNCWVVANVDYRTVGLLRTPSSTSFVDSCTGSFLAPEVERDLLKVSNSSLIEAVNFHAASVSGWMFDLSLYFRLAVAYRDASGSRRTCFLPGGSSTKAKLSARAWRKS